jgi:microcompartment protein CcmK/EutM
VIDAGDGWLVEVRAGTIVVVARGTAARAAEDAHAEGVDAAQRGLDLLSFKGSSTC